MTEMNPSNHSLTSRPPQVAFVIPCYNEEQALPLTMLKMIEILEGLILKNKISANSFVCLIDDGSKDKTWAVIQRLYLESPGKIFGLKLSRNRGHQNALWAGLMESKNRSDVCISLDADLQDDLGVMENFLDEHAKGFDVVYGVRSARQHDTFFKKFTAQFFYKFMNRLGAEVVYDHADYRLTSRRVLEQIERFGDVNLFLRGLFPLVGFSSTTVSYERHERVAGESKYPLSKMLTFAINGITSLSVTPLRLITFIGFFTCIISLIVALWSLFQWISGSVIPGWTSTVLAIYFLGGVQMLCLGVMGEYIGKIYQEVKKRPRYILENRLD